MVMKRGRGSKKKQAAHRAPLSFRRHVLPPALGIVITLAVFGALNGEWLMAQLRYRMNSSNPPAITARVAATPTSEDTQPAPPPTAIDPSLPPELIIPKIQVKAPIVLDEPSYTEWKVQLALRRGVVHYGDTALPGQNGNVVVLGHSSGQAWAAGSYKFVFTMLDKLETGDTFVVNYKGTQYTYEVTTKVVVAPTQMNILNPQGSPTISLVTCTPVGTSKNRLVIQAKQVSPKPVNTPQTVPSKPTSITQLPS